MFEKRGSLGEQFINGGYTGQGEWSGVLRRLEVRDGTGYGPLRASLVVQMVKRLCAMQETRVRSLGWKDPLEKEMAAHSSILAWKIPWMVEPGRLLSMESQRVRHD